MKYALLDSLRTRRISNGHLQEYDETVEPKFTNFDKFVESGRLNH